MFRLCFDMVFLCVEVERQTVGVRETEKESVHDLYRTLQNHTWVGCSFLSSKTCFKLSETVSPLEENGVRLLPAEVKVPIEGQEPFVAVGCLSCNCQSYHRSRPVRLPSRPVLA